jgi:hypothetical protein
MVTLFWFRDDIDDDFERVADIREQQPAAGFSSR